MERRGDWSHGAGRTRVRCELFAVGRDLLLVITGGDAHVGAVATARPADRPGDPPAVRVETVPGHRETELAREGAAALAAATGRVAVAVCGIHRDAATPAEIRGMVAAARAGIAAARRAAADGPARGQGPGTAGQR